MEGNNEVINLISDDEDESALTMRAQPPKRPRHSPLPPPALPNLDDDDEIVVVSHVRKNDRTKSAEPVGAGNEEITETPVTTPSKATPVLGGGNEGDDLVVVTQKTGVKASVDYAHNRFACGVKPFGRGVRINRQFCAKCYCYVCDKPASQCQEWNSHCSATDKSPKWRSARARARPKPPPTIRKRNNFFVPRPRGNPRNGFQFVGGGNRSLMNPISPTSFQDSVLAIIGNPNKLRHTALSQVASLRLSPPVPAANALDALDTALQLQWPPPPPPPPSQIPNLVMLPPLVRNQNRTGALSHDARPKTSISATGPIPNSSSTSLTTPNPIVIPSNTPLQGNPSLISPNTVMSSALSSHNLTSASMGITSRENTVLPLNTAVGVSSSAAAPIPSVSLPPLSHNPAGVQANPAMGHPPTPVTSSTLAAYHSSIIPTSTSLPLSSTDIRSGSVIRNHRNGPNQPPRNASIESVLDNTPLGSPTVTSAAPKVAESPKRLPPNKIPNLGSIMNEPLPSVDWSTIPPIPNPVTSDSRVEGATPVSQPQNNSNEISTAPDRSAAIADPINNDVPIVSSGKLTLPPIASIGTNPPDMDLFPFGAAQNRNTSGVTSSITPLPLPLPNNSASTDTEAEKQKANLFFDSLIPDEVRDNDARDASTETVPTSTTPDGTLEQNLASTTNDVATSSSIPSAPEIHDEADAQNSGDLGSFVNVEPMEGISRPEDEPNMQRREPRSPGSSSPSDDSPGVEERIRMRTQQSVMDPLRGLMTMGLEGNGMTMGNLDLGAVLENGGGDSRPSSCTGKLCKRL